MKARSLSLAALFALVAATSALAADNYGERNEETPRGKIVVSEAPATMSVWDYFFNNPEKYRSMRNGPGEYHVGGMRR
ncbi:hypothetical protein [Shinella zoogloeoides]|uniref:hypothetical protein n=1 Tax=Shinella zoogloeoides TaxID=352475 RepID=UPI001F5A2867|nr:hypothetical protein [Shinella zoogloeoides]